MKYIFYSSIIILLSCNNKVSHNEKSGEQQVNKKKAIENKKEGVINNEINTIKYVDYQYLQTENKSIFKIEYEVSEKRLLVMSIEDAYGNWVQGEVISVKKGEGVLESIFANNETIELENYQKVSYYLADINSNPDTVWKNYISFFSGFLERNEKEEVFFERTAYSINKESFKDSVSFFNDIKSLDKEHILGFYVKYEASVSRDVDLIIKNSKNEWIGGKKIKVEQGNGVLDMKALISEYEKIDSMYKLFLSIRPLNTTYKEDIDIKIVEVPVSDIF